MAFWQQFINSHTTSIVQSALATKKKENKHGLEACSFKLEKSETQNLLSLTELATLWYFNGHVFCTSYLLVKSFGQLEARAKAPLTQVLG